MCAAVFIVIPAKDEGSVLGDVLDELAADCPEGEIVVVDDGSADHTSDIAKSRGAHVLRHAVNLGQGAALVTGIGYALRSGAEVIVTYDADGQMVAADVNRLVEPVVVGDCDVALGTRFGKLAPESIGTRRRLLLRGAVMFTRMTVHLPVTDVHNGFRAFSRKAAEMIAVTQNRMAHASEILHEIARLHLRWTEVPVRIRYTEYSRRKGQSGTAALDILSDLFWGSPK
jgi:glycosyltransferase involved in cell wall biosynthesis